ncbi:hypothetical protein [Streptodolium elevatio]
MDLTSYAHEQHQDCLESNLVHILAAQNSIGARRPSSLSWSWTSCTTPDP